MQKQTYGFVKIYVIEEAMMSQNLYDVVTTTFLGDANYNKPISQFLHLNALFPLAFVSLKKDVSCLSFKSFCFQVT